MDVLAAGLPFTPHVVCSLLDAKQKNVYAALYRLEAGTPIKQHGYSLGPIEEALSFINEPTVFLGDGCALYHDQIVKRVGARAQFAAPELWLPRAATLARLGRERIAQDRLDDPSRLVPMYLYPLDCSVRGPDRPILRPALKP